MDDTYITSDDYHEIECPHCHFKNDFMEELDGIVTFWGEQEPQERTCNDCEKVFIIKEDVIRSWETAKTIEELF